VNRIELIFQTIGVTTVILSSCLPPAIAQTIDKPAKNHNFRTLTNIKNPSRPLTISQAIETDIAQEPNQATETDTDSEFGRLEQDSDRLNLPSLPEEVEIKINEPLTLEQSLALALRNNKDLEEAKLNLVRAEKELQQARAALYPNLDFTANLTESNSAASERSLARFPTSTADSDITQLDSDITLSYNVYTGGSRGADIRRATKNVEFNELNVEISTEQIIFETSSDYYDLQNASAQVNIETAAVEDAQQTLKDAQLLEQAGLGTRFDVLRAEVELANAEQRLTIQIANQSTARRQLAETLSLGQQVNLDTADEIAEAGVWSRSLEETIILGYSDRAELDQLLVRQEINEAQKKIVSSAIKPQVSLFAQYEVLEVYDDDADLADGYSYGARLSWSIFDGGDSLARVRQEETDILIDKTAFANQRNQVRVEVEQAYFGLQANRENIGTSEKAVELAEESLRLARLRFQAGVGTQTDVIEAQTELTTARGNRLDAIIQYNQSLNQLYRAINGLSDLTQAISE